MKYLLLHIDLVYPDEMDDSDFKIFDSKEEAVKSIKWLEDRDKKQLLSTGNAMDAEWAVHLLELPSDPENGHLKYAQEEEKENNSSELKEVTFEEALEITDSCGYILKHLAPEYLADNFGIKIIDWENVKEEQCKPPTTAWNRYHKDPIPMKNEIAAAISGAKKVSIAEAKRITGLSTEHLKTMDPEYLLNTFDIIVEGIFDDKEIGKMRGNGS